MAKVDYWNYRVFKHSKDFFTIKEVYYERDNPVAYTEGNSNPTGHSASELKRDLQLMLEAFGKPFLTEEDFGK